MAEYIAHAGIEGLINPGARPILYEGMDGKIGGMGLNRFLLSDILPGDIPKKRMAPAASLRFITHRLLEKWGCVPLGSPVEAQSALVDDAISNQGAMRDRPVVPSRQLTDGTLDCTYGTWEVAPEDPDDKLIPWLTPRVEVAAMTIRAYCGVDLTAPRDPKIWVPGW